MARTRKEPPLLYGMIYSPRTHTGAASSSLRPFTNWRPPLEFKDHWGFATGGGMGVVEAESPAAVVRAIAPFKPFFEFRLERVETGSEPDSRVVRPGPWAGSAA
jgi:hypothetical protein